MPSGIRRTSASRSPKERLCGNAAAWMNSSTPLCRDTRWWGDACGAVEGGNSSIDSDPVSGEPIGRNHLRIPEKDSVACRMGGEGGAPAFMIRGSRQ